MARPKHEPTEETRAKVAVAAAGGVNHDAIAAEIGISDETLRKYYAEELKHGLDRIVARITNSVVTKALGDGPDSLAAARFFLERRAGWVERQQIETNGVQRIYSAEPLSEEEWIARVQQRQASSAVN